MRRNDENKQNEHKWESTWKQEILFFVMFVVKNVNDGKHEFAQMMKNVSASLQVCFATSILQTWMESVK